MRVPRETRQVIFRNVVAEIVQQEERVEFRGVAEPERAPQVHSRAFDGWFCFAQPLNWSKGHMDLQC